MRIEFNSAVRPTRIAKSIHKQLRARGCTPSYSKVREACAVMFGYRAWNDLLGMVGSGTPSIYDQEAGDLVVGERASVFARRLSDALAIPLKDASEIVLEVGPTSKRPIANPTSSYDRNALVLEMAAAITHRAARIEHAGLHNGKCVRIIYDRHCSDDLSRKMDKTDFDYELTVTDDGSMTVRRLDGGYHANTEFPLRRRLAEPGRGANNISVVPDQLLMAVLGRLNPNAIRLLSSVPSFSIRGYEIARSIPEDSPFSRLVQAVPALGAEIESLAYFENLDFAGDRHERIIFQKKRLIESNRPMDVYFEEVEDIVSKFWPCYPASRDGVFRAIEAASGLKVVESAAHFLRYVAFLSFAPSDKLPSSSAEMEAALSFIARSCHLFSPTCGMSPSAFYDNFDGRWSELKILVDEIKPREYLNMDKVAEVIARSSVADHEVSSQGRVWYPYSEFFGEFRNSLTVHIVRDRGLKALLEAYRDWSRFFHTVYQRPGISVMAADREAFEALSSSRLLPEDLLGVRPYDLLSRIGFRPASFIKATLDARGTFPDRKTVN